MSKNFAAALVPSAPRLVRGLRLCAAALALHGICLWLSSAAKSFFPNAFDPVGELVFWLLAVPALLLASPFAPVLWDLGLMDAPGWFAWPKPLGIALVYMAWIAVLLGLAWAVQQWVMKK